MSFFFQNFQKIFILILVCLRKDVFYHKFSLFSVGKGKNHLLFSWKILLQKIFCTEIYKWKKQKRRKKKKYFPKICFWGLNLGTFKNFSFVISVRWRKDVFSFEIFLFFSFSKRLFYFFTWKKSFPSCEKKGLFFWKKLCRKVFLQVFLIKNATVQ